MQRVQVRRGMSCKSRFELEFDAECWDSSSHLLGNTNSIISTEGMGALLLLSAVPSLRAGFA